MLTVETDAERVEERLRSGRLTCPGCSAALAGWGRARERTVRGQDGSVRLVPRRSRCTGCRAVHAAAEVAQRGTTAAPGLPTTIPGPGRQAIVPRQPCPRARPRCAAPQPTIQHEPCLGGQRDDVVAPVVVGNDLVIAALGRHAEVLEQILADRDRLAPPSMIECAGESRACPA